MVSSLGQDQAMQTMCLGMISEGHESCWQTALHLSSQDRTLLCHLWVIEQFPGIGWMSQHGGPTQSKPWVVFGFEISDWGGEACRARGWRGWVRIKEISKNTIVRSQP
jgi:hypothetical protein